ncbi:MAG TPA: FtsX-like permease family protein [Candidatus Faecousia intestinigallinarum]|nr:FtsX-like permease family protein [Candidatus Faecousia intestinigallinarum]
MKLGFYPKFAFIGIRKNKRLYVPYILTCVGIIMMHYIVTALAGIITEMEDMFGNTTTSALLVFGSWVIAVFSVIFLFYTNSFLMRRRKKEFGLYNILGMGKGNIARILAYETVMIMLFSLLVGLGLGVLLCKLFELGLVNLVRGEVDYVLRLRMDALRQTGCTYLVIFAVILAKNLWSIRNDSPIALLHSENVGEKPPKANWFIALVGVAILGLAYYIAVTIVNPVEALVWFFAAVIMVIVATYMIFISGSVTFCRFLQKCKGYYYKANHFVSVASMTYRMRRNGAGLASICILATMVLVMVATTCCLYFGVEIGINDRYPRDYNLKLFVYEDTPMLETMAQDVKSDLEQLLEERQIPAENTGEYYYSSMGGLVRDGEIILDHESLTDFNITNYSDVVTVQVMPLEDYNRLKNTQETLEEGQAMLFAYHYAYDFDTITLGDKTYTITKRLDSIPMGGDEMANITGTLYLVVPDFQELVSSVAALLNDPNIYPHWYYGFDVPLTKEEQVAFNDAFYDTAYDVITGSTYEGISRSVYPDNKAVMLDEMYGVYGGLLFLGAMLSVVFAAAAALIIYYKQLCEGYEDQSRFAIMQKVGMTEKDIRKSINSQMITVFFMPLIAAGIHLAFAYSILSKLLNLLALTNQNNLMTIAAITFLVFGLLYFIVYKFTSHAYYNIVVGSKEK